LARFPHAFSFEDLQRDNLRKNSVGKMIAGFKPTWQENEFGSKRFYHGMTRGFILNEIFRRLEPNQRTIGEYLRDEINGQLGGGLHMGESLPYVQELSTPTKFEVFSGSLMPYFLSGKIEVSMCNASTQPSQIV